MTFNYIYTANGNMIKNKFNYGVEYFESTKSPETLESLMIQQAEKEARKKKLESELKTAKDTKIVKDIQEAQSKVDGINDELNNLAKTINSLKAQQKIDAKKTELQTNVTKRTIRDANETQTLTDAYNDVINFGLDPKNELEPIKDKYKELVEQSNKANADAANALNINIKTQNELDLAIDAGIYANNLMDERYIFINRGGPLSKIKVLSGIKIEEIRNWLKKDADEARTLRDPYNKLIADGIDPTDELNYYMDQYETAFNTSKTQNKNTVDATYNSSYKYMFTLMKNAEEFQLEKDKLKKMFLDNIKKVRELKRKEDIENLKKNDDNEKQNSNNAYNNALNNGIESNKLLQFQYEYQTALDKSIKANNDAQNAENSIKTTDDDTNVVNLINNAKKLKIIRDNTMKILLDKINELTLLQKEFDERYNTYQEYIKKSKIKDDNETQTLQVAYNNAIAEDIDIESKDELQKLQEKYKTAFNKSIKANIETVNAINSIYNADDEKSAVIIKNNAYKLELERDKLRENLLNRIKELIELNKAFQARNQARKEDIKKRIIKDNTEKLTLLNIYNKAINYGISDINNKLKTAQEEYENAFNKSFYANIDADNAMNSIKTRIDEMKSIIIINNVKNLEQEKELSRTKIFDVIVMLMEYSEKNNERIQNNKRQEEIKRRKIKDDNEKKTFKDSYNTAKKNGIDPTDKLNSLQDQYETALNKSIVANTNASNAVNTMNPKNDEIKIAVTIIIANKLELERDNFKKMLLDKINELTLLKENPYTSAPFTSAPFTSAPYTSAPYTSAPFTTAPITSAPYTSEPNTSAPYTSEPNTSAPFTYAPYTSAPYTSAPFTTAPNTSVLNTSTPFTSEPNTSAPFTTAPNTSVLNTSTPFTSEPNTSAPNTSAPNTSEPNTSEPNTSTPNTSAIEETNAPKKKLPIGFIIGGIIFGVFVIGLIFYFIFFYGK